MTASHYINETKSDMRGIKPGWYAIEDDGELSSGPFSSLEECVKKNHSADERDDGLGQNQTSGHVQTMSALLLIPTK